MASQTEYIGILEKKIEELTGIAIQKNVEANMIDETQDIAASAKAIQDIKVLTKAGAFNAPRNPDIQKTFDLLAAEHLHVEGNGIYENGVSNLPKLPYAKNALEPHMTEQIMNFHYDKHHAGYVKNVNGAYEKMQAALKAGDDAAYNALTVPILFNGGSHLNHTIFWRNMCAGGCPMTAGGDLEKAINAKWGSFDAFQTEFSTKTAGVKGSGWGWLAYNKASKELGVYTTQNQDTVEIVHGAVPLLTCDVWEHAYYLQYQNLRAKFIGEWFKLVNWADVEARFKKAQ